MQNIEELEKYYGYFLEKELLNEVQKVGTLKVIQKDTVIIDVDEYIKFMPLVLEGAIKILREDKKGEELVLYYIEKGDTCAMTLSCCLGQTKSKIRAVAESDVKLIMIPKEKMGEWLGKYKTWQAFVLQSYHSRLDEMLDSLDTIAFLKMDERLLKYLKDKAMVNHNDTITTTHKEIAEDLHTSRVVVSRILKKLENENKIQLFRNSIKVIAL